MEYDETEIHASSELGLQLTDLVILFYFFFSFLKIRISSSELIHL